ncbi:MAG: heavy metal-binding domain-containing protein [Jatrophihabitans sp.]
MTTSSDGSDLAAAGVPADALARLSKNKAGAEGAVFTSDLSVNEFLLVREAGFRPLGLVLGSSIYHLGLQRTSWGRNMELTMLSQAMYHARELAMTRMEAEAHALGADGIVGVRLHVRPQSWGSGIAEFVAIGTAVHAESGEWRSSTGRPFTSDLSGQDFWTLLQAGYAPVALVMGTCVYHVAHRSVGQMMRNAYQNAEIPQFTQAIYDARELAMGRMQAEAETAGAEGIVGVILDENSHVWGQHATEFFAIGTAVSSISDDHVVAPPQMVVSLDR